VCEGWGCEQYSQAGAIVAYLVTEVDLGTGLGHFESIDHRLKAEAALTLS
jgi:hypothetical protein